MTITVSGLEADAAPNRFTVSANIDCDGASRRLAFISEGNHPYLEKAEPSMDPFALSMLIPAMERGEDLVIEGPVDEILLESLRSSVQMLAGQVNRGWKPVKILAESRQESRLPEMQLGAATGMSCGIDSLTTYQLYRDLPGTPEQHRIKLFLHNNVGSHIGKGAFVRQLENVMRFGDGAGIPVVSVAADFSPFYRSPFIKNHILRNVAAALANGHLFQTYHHSAGQSFSKAVSSSRFSGIGAVESVLLPALSTRRHTFRVAGAHLSRFQKTERLLTSEVAHRHLTVCIRDHPEGRDVLNCGRCYKCAAFLAQAEAAGVINNFRATFDVDAYLAHRSHAFLRFLRHSIGDRRLNYDLELLHRLMERGANVPAWIRPFRPLIRHLANRGRPALFEQAPG